jgi:hypothetical protein
VGTTTQLTNWLQLAWDDLTEKDAAQRDTMLAPAGSLLPQADGAEVGEAEVNGLETSQA